MQPEIFRTTHWTVQQCTDVAVPGYVLIVANGCSTTLADMPHPAMEQLAALLPRVLRAVEAAVSPERIYVRMFGESKSALHFHIFPRMDWMQELISEKLSESEPTLDGAALFSRVRRLLSRPSDLEREEPRMERAATEIRRLLLDNVSRCSAKLGQ
jgi:diadenosine tetraphosphate (Ap4A) HIT family hydrolase